MHNAKERKELGLGYCSGCKEELPASLFNSSKIGTNGLYAYCKPCAATRRKLRKAAPEYQDKLLKNREARQAASQALHSKHYKQCLHCGSTYYKAWNIGLAQFERQRLCKRGCPMPIHLRQQIDQAKAARAKTYEATYRKLPEVKERRRASAKAWYERTYKAQKYKWVWRWTLASSLGRRRAQKADKTYRLLGYSAQELKVHLESLFLQGMSWDNHGEWHVDHIRPVNSFSPDTPASTVNALSNLQPLWAADNIRKSDYYDG